MPNRFFLLLLISGFITILSISSCKQEADKTTEQATAPAQVQTVQESSQATEKEITYAQVPVMPRFPGCEDQEKTIEKYICANNRLNNYIHNRLRYPKIALNNKVEGTVVAQFVVRPDGLLDEIGVHNDIGYGCGETVLEIIRSMNYMDERWIPGYKDGKPVRVRLAIPIEFRLMDYQKEEDYVPGK